MEHSFNNPIGKRLKQEMKKHGLNSSELARRSGVLTSFLYDIISGKSANPSTLKLAKVAETLGVSLEFLVGGTEGSVTNDAYTLIPRLTIDTANNTENGELSLRKDWISDHLGAKAGDLRSFTISGDAMSPSLCHGDIVLVDSSKKIPSPPAIFVVFDGVGLAAKRCEYVDGASRIRISTDNPHYAAYEKSSAEASIIGRVVWFSRAV